MPIVVAHGVGFEPKPYLVTPEVLAARLDVAHALGFTTISYDTLADWLREKAPLPARPLKIDFDHPSRSLYTKVRWMIADRGFKATVFINTGVMDDPAFRERVMTWDQLGELVEAGWEVGGHTVTHPDLGVLSAEDPDGAKIEHELDGCDDEIERRLGVRPRCFAFTGNSWSRRAEAAVRLRYRASRLWLMDAWLHTDAGQTRMADFLGVSGTDVDDGPPAAARYATALSSPHRLPALDITAPMIASFAGFERFLKGAFEET